MPSSDCGRSSTPGSPSAPVSTVCDYGQEDTVEGFPKTVDNQRADDHRSDDDETDGPRLLTFAQQLSDHDLLFLRRDITQQSTIDTLGAQCRRRNDVYRPRRGQDGGPGVRQPVSQRLRLVTARSGVAGLGRPTGPEAGAWAASSPARRLTSP